MSKNHIRYFNELWKIAKTIFGKVNLKKDTQKVLDEMDEENGD